MSRVISLQDLRDRLETEEDPQVRSHIEHLLAYVSNPDPLTVTDEPDPLRVRPGRQSQDLRHEHPELSLGPIRDRVSGLRRRLVRAGLVRHRTPGLKRAAR